jgi:hypothetical protein
MVRIGKVVYQGPCHCCAVFSLIYFCLWLPSCWHHHASILFNAGKDGMAFIQIHLWGLHWCKMAPFHPGVCVMCVFRWLNCILLLSFLNFFQNNLPIIHLIPVSHPMFLTQNCPTSASMCSLFTLGESCVVNCILLTYREMKDITMMEFCWASLQDSQIYQHWSLI